MAHDFTFERDQSFGEWLHREMHEAVSFEDAAWAIDRARQREKESCGDSVHIGVGITIELTRAAPLTCNMKQKPHRGVECSDSLGVIRFATNTVSPGSSPPLMLKAHAFV